MLNIRIKSESLKEREYVNFMYKGTPIKITRVWKAIKDEIVLQALKEEPQNFECKENIKIEPIKPKVEDKKEETIIENSGSIKEVKEEVNPVKVQKTKLNSKKSFRK